MHHVNSRLNKGIDSVLFQNPNGIPPPPPPPGRASQPCCWLCVCCLSGAQTEAGEGVRGDGYLRRQQNHLHPRGLFSGHHGNRGSRTRGSHEAATGCQERSVFVVWLYIHPFLARIILLIGQCYSIHGLAHERSISVSLKIMLTCVKLVNSTNKMSTKH